MKTIKILSILFISVLSFTACSSDDDLPQVINEEEVITDVSLEITNATGETAVYTFTDPQYRDETYVSPVILLEENATYMVEARFYNKSNPNNPEDITAEIKEERNAHFVTYAFANANVDLERTDGADAIDSDGIPIGISTKWTTNATASGEMVVRLIHEAEVKDITNPNGSVVGGETDVEAIFDLEIE